jgi:hypothetical protein
LRRLLMLTSKPRRRVEESLKTRSRKSQCCLRLRFKIWMQARLK